MSLSTTMKFITSCLLIVVGVSLVKASVQSSDPCPTRDNLPVMQYFDVEEYSGLWYVQQRYKNQYQKSFGACGKATYTKTSNSSFDIENTYRPYLFPIADQTGSSSSAVASGLPYEAKFNLINKVATPDKPYWVLATDYITYSLVFGCVSSSSGSKRFMKILTRQRYPQQLYVNYLRLYADFLNLDTASLRPVRQDWC